MQSGRLPRAPTFTTTQPTPGCHRARQIISLSLHRLEAAGFRVSAHSSLIHYKILYNDLLYISLSIFYYLITSANFFFSVSPSYVAAPPKFLSISHYLHKLLFLIFIYHLLLFFSITNKYLRAMKSRQRGPAAAPFYLA